jgi:hypothetical protein
MCYRTLDARDVWNCHHDDQFVRILRCTSEKLILTFAITSTIHLFLSVRSASLVERPALTWQPNACPDCQHHHRHGSNFLAEHEVGLTGARFGYAHAHEPFIHSRDVDSRESSDYQTSGFDSPRPSAETLATDIRTDLGDIADCLD